MAIESGKQKIELKEKSYYANNWKNWERSESKGHSLNGKGVSKELIEKTISESKKSIPYHFGKRAGCVSRLWVNLAGAAFFLEGLHIFNPLFFPLVTRWKRNCRMRCENTRIEFLTYWTMKWSSTGPFFLQPFFVAATAFLGGKLRTNWDQSDFLEVNGLGVYCEIEKSSVVPLSIALNPSILATNVSNKYSKQIE